MMQKPPRPTGITILAILDFIGGALAILGGALVVAVASSGILTSYGMGMFSGFISLFGGIIIVAGFFAIFIGWGMWSGKTWAWYLAVVLYVIGVIFGVVSLLGGAVGIVALLIDLLLLWYMFRPHVKAYFGIGGRMMQQAPMMQQPQTTTT